jgi:hypothetical protein
VLLSLKARGTGKDFLNRTPAAQQLRETMNKWNCMKLKSFCTTKEMLSKLKRPPTEWEPDAFCASAQHQVPLCDLGWDT